jgi:hypothetical protein
VQRGDDLLAQGEVVCVEPLADEYGELIAPHSHDEIIRQERLEPPGTLHKEVIPTLVTNKVIDLLKAIQVDGINDVASAPARRDLRIKTLDVATIWKLSQQIMIGNPSGFSFRPVPQLDLFLKLAISPPGIDEAQATAE